MPVNGVDIWLPEGAVEAKPGIVNRYPKLPSLRSEVDQPLQTGTSYSPDEWDVPPRKIEYMIARPEVLAKFNVPYERNHVLNVFAVQTVVKSVGIPVVVDGQFGPATEEAVKKYQSTRRAGIGKPKLVADGIVGPTTQNRMVLGHVWQEEEQHGLPGRYLESQTLGESGLLLSAVNWSVPGGVDCSATQRRVYVLSNGRYDPEALKRAFNLPYQADLSAKQLRNLKEIFYPRAGVQSPIALAYIPTTHERAWRLAGLNHNYPSGADNYSRYSNHRSTYWTSPQSWVSNAGFKFEDGAPVRTPFDWCQNYALGSPEHNDSGNVAELVTSWPV